MHHIPGTPRPPRLPAGSGTLQVGSEAIPAGSEDLPAPSEAHPALSETFPASPEALHAASVAPFSLVTLIVSYGATAQSLPN